MNCRTLYFLFISLLLVITACTSAYDHLRKTEVVPCPVSTFKPVIPYAVYSTSVDVLNKHLSGLLAVKSIPDSSIYTVFQSEMGLTYFEFEWERNGTFHARNVISKMNRKSVINALRNDFELMLMNNLDTSNVSTFSDQQDLYTLYQQGSGFVYRVTDSACTSLKRMESASKRKTIVEMNMFNTSGIPDSVFISHKNFKFNISLRKIKQ
ncbi:MAG: hypothetical protein IPP38_11415 [Bacteroidetes bacterium]|nr:hypothetical protein [Bacteroidota bacterium]